MHRFGKRYISINIEGGESIDPKTLKPRGYRVKTIRFEQGEAILLTSHTSMEGVVRALESKGMKIMGISGSLKRLKRGRKAKSMIPSGMVGMR
ncbi:MAG: hypothetical protein ACE5KG_06965 [Nitrososphaerales archaeon]